MMDPIQWQAARDIAAGGPGWFRVAPAEDAHRLVAALVDEVERLRGGILAALDNLEGGPEAIATAEGALRLALADG